MPSALPDGEPAPVDGRLPQPALDALRGAAFGFYVHVPFCQTRCGYCDFNTYTAAELGPGVSRGGYADTVLREVRLAADVLSRGDVFGDRIPPVSTIFFGGGTPTLLPASHLGVVVREIAERFGLAEDVEITTEANPETVTPGLPQRSARAGFHPHLARHAVGSAARAASTRSAAPAQDGRKPPSPRRARPVSSTSTSI